MSDEVRAWEAGHRVGAASRDAEVADITSDRDKWKSLAEQMQRLLDDPTLTPGAVRAKGYTLMVDADDYEKRVQERDALADELRCLKGDVH